MGFNSGAVGAPFGNGSTYRMRCLSGNTWNTRLFAEGTGNSPRVMRAVKRRCCNMSTTPMLPHRPVDDTDSDHTLLTISARSTSFRIERILRLLPSPFFSRVLRTFRLNGSHTQLNNEGRCKRLLGRCSATP